MDGGVFRRGAVEAEPLLRTRVAKKRHRSSSASAKVVAATGESSFGGGGTPGFTWKPQEASTGSNGVHFSADRPIAVTVSDDPAFHNRTLYISEREGKDRIQLPPHVQFNLLPPPDPKVREVISVAGAAGAGKSFISKEYCRRYYKQWKSKRDVFVVSALKSDETLDELKFIKRIIISSLVDDPLEDPIKAFEDSLVVFDDIEVR